MINVITAILPFAIFILGGWGIERVFKKLPDTWFYTIAKILSGLALLVVFLIIAVKLRDSGYYILYG